ncbi:hypothetical protein KDA_24650 [Dictyobacter alpinus]|uniref:Uncharacterized protein n=1 Tax=Dictyobacter alpinus TaxID=2014873 RepID=A0A402B6J9_9CHLR|nr:hypothetical protein [Dictyobacter alpinus]GCE26981.1 hypothetical protein KDA_24650 [Dictyobacter alpinus]
MSNSDNYSPASRPESGQYADDREFFESLTLPPHGLALALGIGCLGGILAAVLSIAIRFANSSVFQEVARQGDKISYNTALYITGLGCLSYIIGLVLSFVAGFLVGKRAVRRLYGFYAGALAGGISYLVPALISMLPGFANGMSSTAPTTSNFILGIVIWTLIWALSGALLGLWGTFTATKKHPYYLAKKAAAAAAE